MPNHINVSFECNIIAVKTIPDGIANKASADPTVREVQPRNSFKNATSHRIAHQEHLHESYLVHTE